MSHGFVLDASTALSWAFDDESSPSADTALAHLVKGFAFVPAIWGSEVTNTLAAAMRRSRLNGTQAGAFLDALAAFDIRSEVPSASLAELLADALQWGLTSYDASYVALARDRGLPLATQDKAMMKAAKSAGVVVLDAERNLRA